MFFKRFKKKKLKATLIFSILLILFFSIYCFFPRVSETNLTLEFEEKVVPVSPISLPDSGWGTVINQVFEGLFQITRSGQLEPVIVKDWTVDSTFKEFVFEIRKDIRFHDGKLLTPEDVVYSLSYFRKNPPQMSTSFVFSEIFSVEAQTPSSVKIKMKKSSPDFLYFLAAPTVKIFPNGIFERYSKEPLKQWIGTGAFFLKSLKDEEIILERFTDYREPVKLRRIYFKKIEDVQSAFRERKIDVLEISRKDIQKYRSDSQYIVNSYPMLGTFFLGFNLDKKGLQDLNLRKAILYAIDRSKTIDGVNISPGMIPSGVLPYGLLGYHPAEMPKNLSKAKAFLKLVPKKNLPKSGDLEILMPKKPHPMAIFAVERMNKDLAPLGIQFTMRNLEIEYGRGNWGDYFHHLKSTGKFSLYLRGAIAATPSSELFLRDLFDPQSLMNLGNFRSKKYTEYILTPPENILESTLHPYYSKLDDLIQEEVPIIPLGNLYYNLVTFKNSPYKFNAISPYFLNYKDSL